MGEATGRASSRRATKGPIPETSPVSVLDAAQQRRAEALSLFSAGISAQINDGIDAAMPFYEKSFALDPHNIVLAIRLAEVARSKNDIAKSIAILETASQAEPASADIALWLGLAYRATDQPQKAIGILRPAFKADPLNQALLQVLLEVYLQQNALADATATLDQAWRQSSDDPAYWTRLGDIYSAALRQKPPLAKFVDSARPQQCYEKAARLGPRDPVLLAKLGDGYADAGKFDLAIEVYTKVLELAPDTPKLREKLASLHAQAGRREKAAEILEDIIRREPGRYEMYNTLAELYEELKQDEKALSLYQQSLVINENQLAPALLAALVQARLNRFDDALGSLAVAKKKFPTDYRIPYFYAKVYTQHKDYGKALAAFADAETLAGESPDEVKLDSTFYFQYGAAAERAGDLDKAERLFKKCIELDPEKDVALNYLGYMWADKGIRLDEAHDLIQKALALDPENGAYLDSLGWVLYRLGRYEEAVAQLRRAAELITDDAVVFDHYAEALLKLGHRADAITQLRRAVQMDPDNKELVEKLKKLLDEKSDAR